MRTIEVVLLAGLLASCSGDADTPIDASGGGPAIVYLNRNGGAYTVGPNDSVANTQMFTQSPFTAPPFPYGDIEWGLIRDCVAQLYGPFQVTVTDQDPGAVDHVEVVMTTTPSDVGLQPGLASFAPAACDDQRRGLALLFAGVFQSSSTRSICENTAAIAGVTQGLDWALHCPDLASQLTGCGQKAFRDVDTECGEFDARACRCGGTTQNSYQFLATKYGLR